MWMRFDGKNKEGSAGSIEIKAFEFLREGQLASSGLLNKIVLNFWVMPNAGFATRGILQEYIREFEAARPHIRVHLNVHPWSLAWSRVMDVVKGRNTRSVPDVFQVGTTWVT